jgi:hypothetical protein
VLHGVDAEAVEVPKVSSHQIASSVKAALASGTLWLMSGR